MGPSAALPFLPDDVLEDIFLRLDGGADLARAAAACTSFRRIVAGRRFLRRFLSVHPPPLLGFINTGYYRGFLAAQPPRRSAPAARAVVQAADFAYSFLHKPSDWRVQDATGGRVLLSRQTPTTIFDDFVVCDPLHRRYVEIPPIPADHVVSTGRYSAETEFEPFLAPAEEEEADESSFRVVCNVISRHKIVAFMFSSVTGQWRVATSFSPLPDMLISNLPTRHYVRNCFYWVHNWVDRMLVLDLNDMEFSVVGLPQHDVYWHWLAIVDAGEGMLGLLVQLGPYGCALNLYCKTWRNNGVGTEEWRHAKIIPLPHCDGSWQIKGPAEDYILMRALSHQTREQQFFTLELKTLLVERLCVSDQNFYHAHPYASFPPPLSLPRI
ncbi:hypothetical protein ACP70R_032504 [Stipagrostis hirtigluma subsp. patula]